MYRCQQPSGAPGVLLQRGESSIFQPEVALQSAFVSRVPGGHIAAVLQSVERCKESPDGERTFLADGFMNHGTESPGAEFFHALKYCHLQVTNNVSSHASKCRVSVLVLSNMKAPARERKRSKLPRVIVKDADGNVITGKDARKALNKLLRRALGNPR